MVRGAPGPELLASLGAQTRAPDEVLVHPVDPAAGGRARWLWLLDGTAVPEPGALERLMEVAEAPDPLPAPVLLASKVVGPDGSPNRRSLPLPRFLDPDLAVAAVERRVLSIRMARRGSLLVDASHAREPGPDPFERDLEWTARLLRGRAGLLVPGSVAVRAPGAGPPPGDIRTLLRLLGGDALEGRERPWYGFRLAEQALGARTPG